jgi:hypothetical protein
MCYDVYKGEQLAGYVLEFPIEAKQPERVSAVGACGQTSGALKRRLLYYDREKGDKSGKTGRSAKEFKSLKW